MEKEKSHQYTAVAIETVYEDSTSIRAIEIMPGNLAFAGSNGIYGTVNTTNQKVRDDRMVYDTIIPAFRAVAHTSNDFFMLSIGSPALLYKTAGGGKMEVVYKEEGEGVFYDAMTFWNNQEGIAVGDSRNGCLSVIITRDGGGSWQKTPCTAMPEAPKGEGAFAASNTNVVVKGSRTWIATTSGTVYFSPDKGISWEVMQTPIIHEKETEGIYSIAFYDEALGFAIGGDYTSPEISTANKAITFDGGRHWESIANGVEPDYKSCVQFIPNSGGNDLVALGFTGISYSSTMGKTWKELSEEPFYTIRFLNDSVAYAAGRNRIARLTFR
ncbi:WD40/YVTN/BNR-like repeat-containing protein [Spongiimicrobium salis]|uniref:WD40/YVTN/BNR-like repeat-containing protein n=1 Tax=Spongiimicrobium salis TaxID=1667022 RepID=UPI00374DEA5C